MIKTCLVSENKSSGSMSFSNCTTTTNKTNLENKYRDILNKAKADQEKLSTETQVSTESKNSNVVPPVLSQIQSSIPATPIGFFFYSDNVNSICHTSELEPEELALVERVNKLNSLSGEAKRLEQKSINFDITLLSYKHKRIFQDKLLEQREAEKKENEQHYVNYENSCGSSRYSPNYSEDTTENIPTLNSKEENSYEYFDNYLELRGVETGKVEVVSCSEKQPFRSTYVKSIDKKVDRRKASSKIRVKQSD